MGGTWSTGDAVGQPVPQYGPRPRSPHGGNREPATTKDTPDNVTEPVSRSRDRRRNDVRAAGSRQVVWPCRCYREALPQSLGVLPLYDPVIASGWQDAVGDVAPMAGQDGPGPG